MSAPLTPSYLADTWVTPERPTRVTDVSDPATGDVVARSSTDGLDFAGAVAYARERGHAELGSLSFHDRALIIKKLALYLQEHKQQMYELSACSGATARDHVIDIDGGIGTLFTMSSKARREMPRSTVMIDGPTEQLSRDGSFLGEHIYTTLPGVAVQINAFNFPVWGFLEKFAPAFIAGMPSIVKPATATGYITARCVQLMVQSGLLPAGSLQLISGSAGDLLKHLDYRDHVAFTGSARTAEILRSSVDSGVRFSAEADSLNAAILGEGIVPGDPEFDAYISALVTEMSVKAGQKCTAIRRALVPSETLPDVIEALRERLATKVRLGSPHDPESTMGPLVSADQAADVRSAIAQLIDAGGRVEVGGPEPGCTLGEAYVEPTVLSFTGEARHAEAVHEVEAFGPVVSVIEYRGRAEAITLAARGGGSLVATLCSHDPEEVRDVTRQIAAHHGRLHLLDRDDARSSTGHGSPLPHLIHGGPGRAGGGEELGGVRGILHYMQRTAIQGSPDHLTAVTGQWHRGAAVQRVTRADVESGTGVHPFRRSLAELRIGDQFASERRTVRLSDIEEFANSTGDTFYAHTNEEAAMANPFFPRRVAHGYLLVSWAAGLFVEPAPGPVLANYGLDNLRFLTPVTYDDSIRVELTAKRITPRVTDDYGEVIWDAVLYNQREEIVAEYDVITLVAKEGGTEGGR